jgi:hypothetical protein
MALRGGQAPTAVMQKHALVDKSRQTGLNPASRVRL